MLDILQFMAPAIAMCFILVGICGYVGIHVIMREVIFIDIALAQIAALGASLSIFWGLELSSGWTFLISLGVTFLAAFLLAGTRKLSQFVPQEAFIGILYATGAAAILLLGDRLAHGAEHVKELMVGHLLWTNWGEVGRYLFAYAILGGIYALSHKKLITLSQMGRHKNGEAKNIILWEFIFYALMGILVTIAVHVAGVLLVFGFLVVPAVIGSLLGTSFFNRLIIGWITGLVVSIIGAYFSYSLDFPTGATIVVTLGIGLLFVSIFKSFQLRLKKVH